MTSKFLIGADPEIFLEDAVGNLISAIDRIGGTKQSPKPLPLGDGYAVQEDNVAVEYNIPAAKSAEEFAESIQKVMGFLSEQIANMGLRFNRLSAAEFPLEQLNHYKALEFGCDPDFNAWKNGRVNQRPKSDKFCLRSCGGHVHIGFDGFNSRKDVLQFIKRMDLFAAVPSVVMDKGQLRKELYGKAGAFRFKKYGCEYRVLSNFWIFDPELVRWVYAAVDHALTRNDIDVDSEKDLIIEAVNNNNADVAQHLIQKYQLPVIYA